MKSRKGRIFKRVIYFLLSFIALQSIALIIYETLMIMGVVEGSFRQGEAFTFIFAAIICLAVGVVYQLCYKEETSPVTRKIVIGWGALSYPFLQLPGMFSEIRFDMNALSETPNYYIDELLKLETLTLFIVPLFVSLAAAVMIITDMVKNIEAVE